MSLSKPFLPFVLHWGPAIFLMACIFLFSSIPAKEMPSFGGIDLLIKKGGHMLGYGLLGIAYLHGIGRDRQHALWFALILSILYAATDELHQSFVPGRGAWVVDIGIDGAGALLGLFFYTKTRLYTLFAKF